MAPRLLDLFCGAGGASVGYARAGFSVTGVDKWMQLSYPFEIRYGDTFSLDLDWIRSFDAVHASPPCQHYSLLAYRNNSKDRWPALVEPVRNLLRASSLPYIIENVPGAPLLDPVVLCGVAFPRLRVIRHRHFETNFPVVQPDHEDHPLVHTNNKRTRHFGKTNEWLDYVQVTGGSNCSVDSAKDAMDIDWMTRKELDEAIPPIYTEYVGRELMRCLGG